MEQYTLRGMVQRGQGDGKNLGAATANLPLDSAKIQNMPAGLYTCQVQVGEETFAGLVYYGINSLTKADCLEVHLKGYTGELYGEDITLTTTQYLREPRFFATRDALRAQISEDLRTAGWIA